MTVYAVWLNIRHHETVDVAERSLKPFPNHPDGVHLIWEGSFYHGVPGIAEKQSTGWRTLSVRRYLWNHRLASGGFSRLPDDWVVYNKCGVVGCVRAHASCNLPKHSKRRARRLKRIVEQYLKSYEGSE